MGRQDAVNAALDSPCRHSLSCPLLHSAAGLLQLAKAGAQQGTRQPVRKTCPPVDAAPCLTIPHCQILPLTACSNSWGCCCDAECYDPLLEQAIGCSRAAGMLVSAVTAMPRWTDSCVASWLLQPLAQRAWPTTTNAAATSTQAVWWWHRRGLLAFRLAGWLGEESQGSYEPIPQPSPYFSHVCSSLMRRATTTATHLGWDTQLTSKMHPRSRRFWVVVPQVESRMPPAVLTASKSPQTCHAVVALQPAH